MDTKDDFLRLLHRISQLANHDHVKTAKFLLREKITRKQMEQCSDMRDLFDKLITKGYIASDNIDVLKDLTAQVFNDCDVERMIRQYERGEKTSTSRSAGRRQLSDSMSTMASLSSLSSESSTATNVPEIPNRFKKLFDYTSSRIGEDWKILARLMGLLDHDIENITKQTEGNYAQATRVMHCWYGQQKAPSTREFRRLLRRIPRNDIADDLQEQLSKH